MGLENFVDFYGLCFFCGFCEGFEDFFVGFLEFLWNFMWVFLRFCVVGLLSFSIRACIGVSTCSLREVGLVGPETRMLMTFVLVLSFVIV